jgi:5-(aminomethyl)-3-furanmethanol phosphate kinase
MHDPLVIVKVGGSLYDLPDLRQRLSAFLSSLEACRVLLVPGGGQAADVIRTFDRAHQLGEEVAHWLAIQALSVNASFLQALLPTASIVSSIAEKSSSDWCILDPLPVFRADDAHSDHLPHHWQVTSDSLAIRVAVLTGARRLILLKSTDWHGNDWAQAQEAKVVDGYFALALRQVPDLNIQIVNLRGTE